MIGETERQVRGNSKVNGWRGHLWWGTKFYGGFVKILADGRSLSQFLLPLLGETLTFS